MDIRNTRQLKSFAAERIANAPQEKKIILIYSLILTAIALLTTVVSYVLGLRIDQLGGLSNMSTRSTLSTLQSMLPLIQSMVTMCLTLGYTAAMLRVARGQYSSPNTLRLGFDRFWVLMRCVVIQGFIYTGMIISAIYVASMLFVLSPLSRAFNEQAAPLLSQSTLLSPGMALDEAAVMELIPSMIPLFILATVIALILVISVSLRFRMANYILIDKPGTGAFAALRESRKMMRRNCLKLLKLDLSYWWYFLILLAVSLVGNLDLYLPLLGVELPMDPTIAYFFFFIVSLALQLAVYYFLRNRMEVTYALVYDSLKPEEPQNNGVVLGNIFQM